MSYLGVAVVALALAAQAAGVFGAEMPGERWRRTITAPARGEVCAVLDAAVFAHAAPSLKDLRLFGPAGEVPYVVTVSEAAEPEGDAARVVGSRAGGGGVVVELEMPRRRYTEVVLELPAAKDFSALATVEGTNDLRLGSGVRVGEGSVFDLSARGLGRETTIALEESGFRYLRIVLHGRGLLPGMVTGAEVPPSREAQTVYTTVARTQEMVHRGGDTVAIFAVPAHVPVERVTVSSPERGSFSRAVRVFARSGMVTESIDAAILRVHLGRMRMERMAFAASLGANLQQDAVVEVAVADGRGGPLPIDSVSLEMRQRRICYASPGVPVTLLYGDAALAAPVYGYGAAGRSGTATLGAEERNPSFREATPAATGRDATGLRWVAFVAIMGLSGTFLLRVLRRRHGGDCQGW